MKKKLSNIVATVIALALLIPSVTTLIDATIGASPDTLLVSNIVIFAHFNDALQSDIDEFESLEYANEVKDIYDDGTVRSFSGYMDAISYGQMNVINSFPQDTGNGIDSFELPISKERTAYTPMTSSIVDMIIPHIDFSDANLPTGLNLNSDGYVDYITIILLETDTITQVEYPTIWPHQMDYKGNTTIDGLSLNNINVLNTDRLSSVSDGEAGLIAHEFLHGYDYADLYTNNSSLQFVHDWDIMSRPSAFLQYPLAYTRQKFSNWITIEEITESTENLRLDIQSNPDGNQAFIIKSPLNNYEYFVVEYRVKGNELASDETFLDSKIPGTGIIIYRVDTTVTGSKNSHGETHIYLFRDGEDKYKEMSQTYFVTGDTFGRADMSMGIYDNALTYNDGRNSGVVIENIEIAADSQSVTFDVKVPVADDFDLWQDNEYQNINNANLSSRSVNSLSYNDTIYILEGLDIESGNDIFTLKSFNGESYTTLASFQTPNTQLSTTKMFAANGKIYFGFSEIVTDERTDIVIKEYDIETNRWSSGEVFRVSNGATSGNFDIYADSENIYVYHTSELGDKLYLVVYDLAAKTTQTYNNSAANENAHTIGNPRITERDGTIYAFHRTGVIKGYTFKGGAFTQVSVGNVSANFFDMVNYNNSFYCIAYNYTAGFSLESSFHRFSETGVEEIDVSVGNLSQTKITVSEGNLYVVGLNSENQVAAYKYDEALSDLVQEGEIVDKAIDGSSFDLSTIGNTLYISYKNGSGNIVLKSKTAADKLVSITADIPSALVFKEGDTISADGISVTANYTNSRRVLTSGEYSISNFDTATIGERTATIEFFGKTTSFVYLVEEDVEIIYAKGDINRDGTVDIADFNELMRLISEEAVYNSFNDLNGDTRINVIDAQMLYEHIEGIKNLS